MTRALPALATVVAATLALLTMAPSPAGAGFRSPESLVRNVYAYYGDGAPELSGGLPRDEDTARQFFDPGLQRSWLAAKSLPYDFFVQSQGWKVRDLAIAVLRRQYDRTYVAVTFTNKGKPVSLNFIVVKAPDDWVITDVETPHDSLREFLAQFRN